MYGADPLGRLGELPRAELRSQGRISTACYDSALGLAPELTIMGTNFPTRDGTCIRDYVNGARGRERRAPRRAADAAPQ